MYREKNITIIPYNKGAQKSLNYLSDHFNIHINPIVPKFIKDENPTDLYILTTTLFMDESIHMCRNIRSTNILTPVLVVSEVYDEIEAITYFEIGADDYVALPLKQREFISRIKALMRRANWELEKPESVLEIGNIAIHPESYSVYKGGIQVQFKHAEVKTLIHLIKNENKILARLDILKHIEGNLTGSREPRVIDVYISRLRNLLGLIHSDPSTPFHIRTVIGSGYVFERAKKEQSTKSG